MLRQLTLLLLTGVMALLANFAHAEKLNVRLILSDSTPGYQKFADALDRTLGAGSITLISSGVDSPPPPDNAKFDLTIAVGTKAAEFAATHVDTPLLSVMVVRSAYETLHEKRRALRSAKPMSAIYLDQPWDRQFNFIRAALPGRNVIGLLHTPGALPALPRPPPGMSINVQSINSADTFYKTLENTLDNSDVLLATTDSEIYNSQNLRNILLTGYRKKIPLIGISQSYVNAGALYAIFSIPEQIAAQTAETLTLFASNRQWPEPQYPHAYSIAVNQQVARSLEITPDTPEAIRIRMDKESGR